MHYRLIFLLIIVLLSCRKKEEYAAVKIIGHAATGLKSPGAVFHDNSGEAIEMALETYGCDGVELDVQMSLTGSLWLFHDPKMSDETTEKGCIGTKSDIDLSEITYKSFHREKILALRNISFKRLKNKTLMLDLRHYNYCTQTMVPVANMVDSLLSVPQLQSGEIEVLVLLSTTSWFPYFANTPFQVIYGDADYEKAWEVLSAQDFDGVMIKNSQISREQVASLKSAGKKVIIFEVRSPKGIRSALKKQPDYLVTDDLRATIIEKY